MPEWFPTRRDNSNGWHFDIVGLLAVIGESSMNNHSQPITASWSCILPRLIPAPQALLRTMRPVRLPAKRDVTVMGVYGGTHISELNYFANILHEVEELKPYEFQVYDIKYSDEAMGAKYQSEVNVEKETHVEDTSNFSTKVKKRISLGDRSKSQIDEEKGQLPASNGTISNLRPPADPVSSRPQPEQDRKTSTTSVQGRHSGGDRPGEEQLSPIEEGNTNSSLQSSIEQADQEPVQPAARTTDQPAAQAADQPAARTSGQYTHQATVQYPARPTIQPTFQPPRRASTHPLSPTSEGLMQIEGKPPGTPYTYLPRIPTNLKSPLNLLTYVSFLGTIGLIVWAALIHDGVACVALVTISLSTCLTCRASQWRPTLSQRSTKAKVPYGDVAIRTRNGALIVVRCEEELARELYFGTEVCDYLVGEKQHQFLVAISTVLLMVAVVLLGNCGWTMQAAVGASYIMLNGFYWGVAMIPNNSKITWNLGRYAVKRHKTSLKLALDKLEVAKHPDSFTKTLWHAIWETKEVKWIRDGDFAPRNKAWDDWLAEAEKHYEDPTWDAVAYKDKLMRAVDQTVTARHLKGRIMTTDSATSTKDKLRRRLLFGQGRN